MCAIRKEVLVSVCPRILLTISCNFKRNVTTKKCGSPCTARVCRGLICSAVREWMHLVCKWSLSFSEISAYAREYVSAIEKGG